MKNETTLFYLYADTFFKRTNDDKPFFVRLGSSSLDASPRVELSLDELYDHWKKNVKWVNERDYYVIIDVFDDKIKAIAHGAVNMEYLTFKHIFESNAEYYNGKGTLNYKGVVYSCEFEDYETRNLELSGKKLSL